MERSKQKVFQAKRAFATNQISIPQEDIESIFPDYLWDKLGPCLEHLSKLGIKGVVQGDLMFNEEMKRQTEIDGKEYIVFKPQKITYAFPVDSEVGKRIANAKLGIIFHTNYTGDAMNDMEADFNEMPSFKNNKDVWFDDATFKDVTGSVLLTKNEQVQVKQDLADAMAAYNAIPRDLLEAVKTNKDCVQYWKRTVNDYVRANKLPGDPDQFLNDFIDVYKNVIQKGIVMKNRDPVELRMDKLESRLILLMQIEKV